MQLFEKPESTIAAFYEKRTGSWQYVISDRASNEAAVIDPVWNYDPKAGAVSTESADEIAAYIEDAGLKVAWILDTHPHADHFSAAPYLATKFNAPTAIGDRVVRVQQLWKDIYCLEDLPTDGRQWDHLFAEGDTLSVGELQGRVLFSPGHTMASITFVFGSSAFVHDTLMVPDSGTSRADFPGGDARALWKSIRQILDLPSETALFVGHDYCKGGRDPNCMATVAQHRKENIHVHDGIGEEEFVKVRTERDATLSLPDLMLAALQVNIRGGRLPPPESCGRSMLRIPINYFQPTGSAG